MRKIFIAATAVMLTTGASLFGASAAEQDKRQDHEYGEYVIAERYDQQRGGSQDRSAETAAPVHDPVQAQYDQRQRINGKDIDVACAQVTLQRRERHEDQPAEERGKFSPGTKVPG